MQPEIHGFLGFLLEAVATGVFVFRDAVHGKGGWLGRSFF